MSDYDIITVGGGLGASALGNAMAEKGKRVLTLERETKFKDRVRGEGMTPWGAAEAREMGVYDLLTSSCAHEVPIWENFAGPMQMVRRDMPSTTPQAAPTLAFYHPDMQQTMQDAAAAAGVTVLSGVRATDVTPGAEPRVRFERDGGAVEEATARVVIGADGRGSLMRKWGGFTEQRDPDRLRIGGLVFEDSKAPQDVVRLVSDFANGRAAIAFPQGNGRLRTYFVCGTHEGVRLQGEKDIPQFIDACTKLGMPAEYFDNARPAGPLATFEGADNWVEHPYRDGIALIGDAATSTDPSWGQGLSLTLRDARVLRDALLANDDWNVAGDAYATEHDRYVHVLRTVLGWMTTFFYDASPEGDARRAQSFPRMIQDPTRQPDTVFSGPDHPIDDTMRRRFFGEE